MHITISKTFQQTDLENSLVDNIREANSKQWIHLSDRHGLGDAFILQAERDQGITIWIWFTTETAWEKMKTICQEFPQDIGQEVLLDIMRELVLRLTPTSTVRPQRVQINCANFDNIFGWCDVLKIAYDHI